MILWTLCDNFFMKMGYLHVLHWDEAEASSCLYRIVAMRLWGRIENGLFFLYVIGVVLLILDSMKLMHHPFILNRRYATMGVD